MLDTVLFGVVPYDAADSTFLTAMPYSDTRYVVMAANNIGVLLGKKYTTLEILYLVHEVIEETRPIFPIRDDIDVHTAKLREILDSAYTYKDDQQFTLKNIENDTTYAHPETDGIFGSAFIGDFKLHHPWIYYLALFIVMFVQDHKDCLLHISVPGIVRPKAWYEDIYCAIDTICNSVMNGNQVKVDFGNHEDKNKVCTHRSRESPTDCIQQTN